MILFANALIQNSVVEFYHKKASVKITAKKIEKQNDNDIEAQDVEAYIQFSGFKENVVIKAQKLFFNPKKFICHAIKNIQLDWMHLSVHSSDIVFEIQNALAYSNIGGTAYYKQWTFKAPQLLYRHTQKTLECQKGCEIFDKESSLKAHYGIAEFEKWFQLSKGVWFKNKEFELKSEKIVCFLNKNQHISKIEAPDHTEVKTQNAVLNGRDILYENDKIFVRHKAHCIISGV